MPCHADQAGGCVGSPRASSSGAPQGDLPSNPTRAGVLSALPQRCQQLPAEPSSQPPTPTPPRTQRRVLTRPQVQAHEGPHSVGEAEAARAGGGVEPNTVFVGGATPLGRQNRAPARRASKQACKRQAGRGGAGSGVKACHGYAGRRAPSQGAKSPSCRGRWPHARWRRHTTAPCGKGRWRVRRCGMLQLCICIWLCIPICMWIVATYVCGAWWPHAMRGGPSLLYGYALT